MVLHCDFYSVVLRRNTHINVILPTPGEPGQKVQQDMKVLYLLHGLHGDESSWLHGSNISRYANEAGIAVVIPGVGNSWYQNMAHGEDFFTYITEELYEYVQALFPVSRKRKDTYIAGLSMGGYGAWYLALACPEKFAATASFSGAVDVGCVRPLREGEGQGHPAPDVPVLRYCGFPVRHECGRQQEAHRNGCQDHLAGDAWCGSCLGFLGQRDSLGFEELAV